MSNLQVRPKWTRYHCDIKGGDIVIVKDENMPRNQWQLVRVGWSCQESQACNSK